MTRGQQLNEGDLVQLGGGGPVMSVTEVHGQKVTCLWFDSAGHLQERTFTAINLRVVSDANGTTDKGVSGS